MSHSANRMENNTLNETVRQFCPETEVAFMSDISDRLFLRHEMGAGMSAFWAVTLFFLILGIGSYGLGSNKENEQQRDEDYRDGYDDGCGNGYEDGYYEHHDEDYFDGDFFE